MLDSLDGIIFTGGIGENLLTVVDPPSNLKDSGFVEDVAGNEAVRFGAEGIIAKSEMLGAEAMYIFNQ
ncbi:hypothetical protein O9993_00480 [Vibrio lentus]|nr:hypothetical protein [Vibrio lentus]